MELGQLLALSVMLGVILLWRKSALFNRQATAANALILFAGFVLMGYQLAGYFTGARA